MRLMVSGTTKSVARMAGRYPDHLGLLLTPANHNATTTTAATGLPWCLDNGAFSGFDPGAFRRLLRRAAGLPGCLFAVCPDVVADARGTIDLYGQWRDEVAAAGFPVAFVLQDGQERYELPAAEAYFIGGSTRWKLSHAAAVLAGEAKRRGRYLHMGRCNTQRRMTAAYDLGCDSVDGSIFSRMERKFLRWAVEHLVRLHAQPTLTFT